MNELALFAGAGGGILGGHLLGWRTVAAVEIEDYPRRVLLQRQADGFLPRFPIWDDICTFDGKPWRGKVDVISGGFPCQDISIDLMEKDQDYGAKWRELLARYNPLTHSWRTLQCSLFEDLELSLETFPRWGMTVGGELFQLQTLVQTINVNESGLWLTPSTVDIPTRSKESMEKRFAYREKIGRHGVGAGCLSEQVTWSGSGNPVGYMRKEIFPTPNAWDGKRGPMSKELMESGKHQVTLVTHVKHFQTPVARMWKDNGKSPSELNRNSQTLATQAGGSLNPNWVEWLMGWPIGFTDLKPLEMDKSHCVQQQHGES